MAMSLDDAVRKQLADSLRKGLAHAPFERIIKGFPVDRAGERPAGLPHSAWELLEHIRIAQDDILRFSKSSEYQEMKWPEEYWPPTAGPVDATAWAQSVEAFHKDLDEFVGLLLDSNRKLTEPFPWGDGQTLLREALLILDHNSHHLGQLILVRKALGAW